MTIASTAKPARAEFVEALSLLCTHWAEAGQPPSAALQSLRTGFDKLGVGGFGSDALYPQTKIPA